MSQRSESRTARDLCSHLREPTPSDSPPPALTEAGQHRSAGAADLLIAATAERERLAILCDGRDSWTSRPVTGQRVKIITET